MKRILSLAFVAGVLLAGDSWAARRDLDTYWVVEAFPASFFVSMDSSDFSIETATERETIANVSYFPNLATGLGIELERAYLDVTAGLGMLVNGTIASYAASINGALYWEIDRSILVGPRLGLLYFFGSEWSGIGDVELGENSGFILGFQAVMGDKIAYLLSVDFMSTEFDVTTAPGVTASESTIDFSGVALQFGIRGQF